MGLPKSERLYHRKQIEHLFAHGKSILSFPLKLIYGDNPYEVDVPIKVLVSVPKRHFKRAVHRNLLKRRLRESFRLLKKEYLKTPSHPQSMGFIFVGKECSNFQQIQTAMKELLIRYQNAH